jgi:hypothetical protein
MYGQQASKAFWSRKPGIPREGDKVMKKRLKMMHDPWIAECKYTNGTDGNS